jgi:DNA-directed RNA polymerase subunit RPC12/RpoP
MRCSKCGGLLKPLATRSWECRRCKWKFLLVEVAPGEEVDWIYFKEV